MGKSAKPPLTAELLKAYLSYNPETGDFVRLKCDRPERIGEIAQISNASGYFQVGFAGHCCPAHRMAWLYVYGEIPKGYIDHIDGDRKNNRISNLRVVSNAQNCQNRRTPCARNKARVLGVVKTANGKFVAQIKKDYKSIHLGTFDTPEAAHHAYLSAKRTLHPFGEIAKEGAQS